MQYANFKEEKELWKQGYERVVGLDEAGRGPLAGPVVAAAVLIAPDVRLRLRRQFNIKDSKVLSQKQREFFYAKLTNHENIRWGTGVVSENVIDRINIFEAAKLAMKKALGSLDVLPDFLLLDGNFFIESPIPQKPIIAADQKVFSCTAAGIIAKVTRDRIMQKMHAKYPQYGFDRHKGYGTALHLERLEAFGPCKIHRRGFQPVSTYLNGSISGG